MTDEAKDAAFESIKEALGEIPGLTLATDEEVEQLLARHTAWRDQQEAADRDAGKIFITEEGDRETIDQWYEDAKGMTPERLPRFLDHLMQTYHHDYGTCVHAVTAGTLATAWAMNESPAGGLSHFQASVVMWEFVARWMDEKGPLRFIRYADLLYPQNVERVTRLSWETWLYLRREAQRLLDEREVDPHPDVLAHWRRLAAGEVLEGFTVEPESP